MASRSAVAMLTDRAELLLPVAVALATAEVLPLAVASAVAVLLPLAALVATARPPPLDVAVALATAPAGAAGQAKGRSGRPCSCRLLLGRGAVCKACMHTRARRAGGRWLRQRVLPCPPKCMACCCSKQNAQATCGHGHAMLTMVWPVVGSGAGAVGSGRGAHSAAENRGSRDPPANLMRPPPCTCSTCRVGQLQCSRQLMPPHHMHAHVKQQCSPCHACLAG